MDYEAYVEDQAEAEVDEDEIWVLDPKVNPLVNVVTFGWTEDGRCGYASDPKKAMQWCPKPVDALRVAAPPVRKSNLAPPPPAPRFVCKSSAAGSRHTLFMLVDTTPKDPEADNEVQQAPKRLHRVALAGLNQVGLCEERGYDTPVEVQIQHEYEGDRPRSLVAGRGCSFVVTDMGAVFSFGHGHQGVLGHEDCLTVHIPTRIRSLAHKTVLKVATGNAHCMALTDAQEVFSWGCNRLGQLGLGFESPYELKMTQIVFGAQAKYAASDISCGHSHSIALVTAKNRLGVDEASVYCWGDHSRGQLGSGDAVYHARPQQNQWLTKVLTSNKITLKGIYAGGHHNLALIKLSGQVISWGASEYGQLGTGVLWDDPYPRIINNLKGVIHMDAGLRHNVAVCDNNSTEVFTWGYNGSGELGLSDTDLRLQPTHVTAIKNTKVLGCSCGDRHTVVLTTPSPVTAKDDTTLKPYFKILQAGGASAAIRKRLEHSMAKLGLDPASLDDPDAVLPSQIGADDKELKNNAYATGLRYCLDTHMDPHDWRRKALETCFECFTKTQHLKSVCLSCARNCLFANKLRPYIRNRQEGDGCDCRLAGACMCAWSNVRAQFDNIIDEDKCIAPRQVRGLLRVLRAPYQVEGIDVEDCMLNLAEGREEEHYPRIAAVPFEKWFRKYYDDELEDPDKDAKKTASGFTRSSKSNKSNKSDSN